MANVYVGNLVSAARQNYHYAWLIVGMAVVLQVTTNAVSQAFAILMVVIQQEFGWALTWITLAYFFRSIMGAVLSPVAGWLGDRYGARRVLIMGAITYVVGLVLLGTMDQIWQLYLYYSFILGISQAMFRVNIPTTVAAWFKTRLGVATGLQQSAGGMGTSIVAPALAVLLSRTDWNTAMWIIAAVGGVIVVGLVSQFHGDPASRRMKPFGADKGESPPPAKSTDFANAKLRSQVFLRQARRTSAFWNLIAIHYLGCVGHAIVFVGVIFYATTRGISLEAAAFIITIYSLASVGSRFMTPVLADHFGAKGVMALAYFVQGISVFLLLWTTELWHFYGFAVLFGLGMGGEMSAFLVVNRQYYGMGPVRAVFGFQSMGAGMGMALGGLIAGFVYDIFGSYDVAWYISIAASFGGAICILFLQSTSRLLIPDWEDSLPPEARTAPTAVSQAISAAGD
ncbi:MAG: MFS transporter [Chloroflexi bacterium]|nr:MFS transporter [Chloroflexota bacterium]MDA1220149.1 MFS transporter [Chloroflexota bacterium]